MSPPASAELVSPARGFEAKRLGDGWQGVAILAGFLLVHVVTTATGVAGRGRFDATFGASVTVARLALALGTALVIVPLALQVARDGLGARRASEGRGTGTLRADRARRVAAGLSLAFVVWHLATLPLRSAWLGLEAGSLFDALAGDLSSTTAGVPLRALAYLAGLAATVFYVAASIGQLATRSPALAHRQGARRGVAWGAGVVGAIVFVLGANTVVFFATGSRLFPVSPAAPAGAPARRP